MEMGGNIVPVTKSGDQLYINFHAFRENRLPFTVRMRDANQDNAGRIAFMSQPKSARAETTIQPICTLNLTLPEFAKVSEVLRFAYMLNIYPQVNSKKKVCLNYCTDTQYLWSNHASYRRMQKSKIKTLKK